MLPYNPQTVNLGEGSYRGRLIRLHFSIPSRTNKRAVLEFFVLGGTGV
jgi:hypothetical protein